jgi:hypothetical protein
MAVRPLWPDGRGFVLRLREVVARTPFRGLDLKDLHPDRLPVVLRSPAARAFSELRLPLRTWYLEPAEAAAEQARMLDALRAFVAARGPTGLRRLAVPVLADPDGLAAVAALPLAGVESFEAPFPAGVLRPMPGWAETLAAAGWLAALRSLTNPYEWDWEAFGRAARLPALHTLCLNRPASFAPAALKAVARAAPNLAALHLSPDRLPVGAGRAIADAGFGRLAVLSLAGTGLTGDAVADLTAAPFAGTLHTLDLWDCPVGTKGFAALARSEFRLRRLVLQPGTTTIGRSGLRALATADPFAGLTTLTLEMPTTKSCPEPAAVAEFLAGWRGPRLRHLTVAHLPVGDAGAKAIARNPAFASLTRLYLSFTGVGAAGAKALFASPHLGRLLDLRLQGCPVGSAAAALADPAVLPDLGHCLLSEDAVPPAAARAAARRPGVRLI